MKMSSLPTYALCNKDANLASQKPKCSEKVWGNILIQINLESSFAGENFVLDSILQKRSKT